jgi:hypothetical protein
MIIAKTYTFGNKNLKKIPPRLPRLFEAVGGWLQVYLLFLSVLVVACDLTDVAGPDILQSIYLLPFQSISGSLSIDSVV